MLTLVKPKIIRDSRKKLLTEDQVKHIYKKVESGNVINISALKQEIDKE